MLQNLRRKEKEKANCDSASHMEESLDNCFSRCTDKHQVDQRGESGKCNVCSAPCSSCFHNDNVLMKTGDESSGENYTENVESGTSELRSMTGVTSNSDSFSETALLRGSSRASSVSALDDRASRPQSGSHRHQEVLNDCVSGVSGDNEGLIKKSHLDNVKFSKQTTGECVEGMELETAHNAFSETSNEKEKAQKKVSEDKCGGVKNEIFESTYEHSHTVAPSDAKCDDMASPLLISVKKEEDVPLKVNHADEIEDSDIVEQDVKVCDICGDAGREDLLAICSQCSDGAEHTYCMREMLDKVPEADWVCEECQNLERADSEKQKTIGRVAENERNNSSCHSSGEYVNAADVEGQGRKDDSKVNSKRQRDDTDAEVSSKFKKPATESKMLNSGILASSAAALSRTSSSRGLGKSSAESIHVNEAMELTAPAKKSSWHKVQGGLLKLKSLDLPNSNSKGKLLDQDIIPRQRSVKEHASGHRNEDPFRSVGRSTSFKSTNSVRSEPKVKMLSSRPSEIQVMRSIKQKTSFERQISVKTEQPAISPSASASKLDKRSAVGGGYSSVNASVCKQETKPAQSAGVSTSLSRSSSLQTRKTVDPPASVGDYKKISSYTNVSGGVSSGSGINKIDNKRPCQTSLSVDEGTADALSREANFVDSSEQAKVYSESRFARSAAKPSKDETPSVRAAIEAASLKKSLTYLRNRNMGQSDASPVASSVSELNPSQDCRASLFERKKVSTGTEQVEKVSLYHNPEGVKQESVSNLRQSSLVAIKDQSSAGKSDGCSSNSLREHFQNVPVPIPSFVKQIAIPEHECIWQGSFEISGSGKFVKSFDGIQAHLSSVASPKVIETVKKFKSRIILNEVPRISSWPRQFQEHGARDDNIALFFFAKDLESYNKAYKGTLDNMIRKDLAFKGSVDGVELLVFPSTLLPDISQRWNMLFFMWGVFRAKQEISLKHKPETSIQMSAFQDTLKPKMAFPDDVHSTRPAVKVLVDLAPGLGVLSGDSQSLKVKDKDECVEVSVSDLHDRKMNSFSQVEMNLDKANEDVVACLQKEGIIAHKSPPCDSNTDSGEKPIPTKLESSFDTKSLQHHSRELAESSSVTVFGGEKILSSKQQPVEPAYDARETITNQKPVKKYEGFLGDLNEEPDPSLGDDDESELPGTSELPLRFGSQHDDTFNIKDKPLDTERYLFPIKSPPIKDVILASGSSNSSKKMHIPVQDRAFDQPPVLELALGRERSRSIHDSIWPPPLSGSVADEPARVQEIPSPNDVSPSATSLSLSLSFPFPDNEQKPKEERFSNKGCTKNMGLLFENLRGK